MRCGSNFLLSGLEDHPNIRAFNEIFNNHARDRSPVSGRVYQDDEPGDAFLEYVFSLPQPSNIKAVGFKWFGNQCRYDVNGLRAWRWYRERRSIRVIFIDRTNWLSMVVSRYTAETTGQWFQRADEPMLSVPGVGRITVPPEYCAAAFREIATAHAHVLEDAIDHPLLIVDYASMAADFQATMDQIADFLNVPRRVAAPKSVKLSSAPLVERVANWNELRDNFRGTAYAPFFELAHHSC